MRKRGEQKFGKEWLFTMTYLMMIVSGKVCFELSKRGEEKSLKDCSAVI